MGHHHWGRGALAAVLVLLSTACAPDVDDLPEGGSQLEPTFRPGPGEDARERRSDRGDRERRDPAGSGRPSASAQDGTPSPEPAAEVTPAGATAPPTSATAAGARVSDPAGDLSGLGDAPAFVDLRGAVLTRTGDGYRLVVDTAGTLPPRQEGDRTMNVVGFVDRDLDGTVDHEVWAALADDGWGSSSRHPDGARFGDDSGVRVTVSGSTLTMVFAASVIGGSDTFQWSVASEYGTLEQVASGTTTRDHAPDGGGAPFPG